ncbi:hypothetical protein Poly41_70570 [Novipirellula artificiosorum]|uniref:Uncharacterized protein n=2 Tax=Novipirellula artificiosorum TaxID=2528016 RepID=A0A5C6CNW0_9BACT|nr:hypothetical protein Poly41_70570 [Novipirellula artificiosorum]
MGRVKTVKLLRCGTKMTYRVLGSLANVWATRDQDVAMDAPLMKYAQGIAASAAASLSRACVICLGGSR